MPKVLKKTLFLAPVALSLAYLITEEKISYGSAGIFMLAMATGVIIEHLFTLRSSNDAAKSYSKRPSLFVNIMENLTDPLIFLDEDSNVILANNSAKEMYDHELIDSKIADFLFDSDALAAINKAIETGESDTVEYSTPHPRQKYYLLRIHVHNNFATDDDNDEFLGERTTLLTIYDITSIREAERMRVDFVANVSHELRTPLASILGFVETLQGPARDDPKAMMRFLKIMQDEASRMTRLIEDLLSLSHIEREAHIPPSEEISLVKIIESVVETLNFQMKRRDMTVKLNSEIDDCMVIGDRDQLTQVFQNLIDNAVKYGAPETEIAIHLHSQIEIGDEQENIQIAITNEGQGIAPEHIKRLTERFYRVDTARSRSLGGTGLGLAIVKHIIQRHEGDLSFESEVGKYTTARIQLPMNS